MIDSAVAGTAETAEQQAVGGAAEEKEAERELREGDWRCSCSRSQQAVGGAAGEKEAERELREGDERCSCSRSQQAVGGAAGEKEKQSESCARVI